MFTATVTISEEQIASLLATACEGGSNYWIDTISTKKPDSWEFQAFADDSQEGPEKWYYNYPLNHGGALIYKVEDDDKQYTLDRDAIQRGIDILATTHHLADVLTDNADAETADAFLQFALFGELVYC